MLNAYQISDPVNGNFINQGFPGLLDEVGNPVFIAGRAGCFY
jgi:hypothetical protein